jgi:phosphoserine phosphatase RsbU/P
MLTWLNHAVCRELRQTRDLIVTFTACPVDRAAMTLSYANAGHPPFYFVRGGDVLKLESASMPLGFSTDAKYGTRGIPVHAGDRIVLFADGLIEIGAFMTDADEDSLRRLLAVQAPLGEFNDGLLRGRLSSAGRQDFTDDVTVVTMDVKG